jgi:hypothetical protein
MYSWVTLNEGSHDFTIKDGEALFNIEQIVWSADASVPEHPYATLSLPFMFTIPKVESNPLPAALHCGGRLNGGHIQYYVHAVSEPLMQSICPHTH